MALTLFEDPLYLEAVYAALFALLGSATLPKGISFVTKERVVLLPDQVDASAQPALMLVEGPLHAEQKQVFGPTKWILTAVAVIYVRADGSSPSSQSPLPIQVANYIVWGLSRVFETKPPYQKQTLGDLVYHCWIEGEILSEVIDQQMVISIPIFILPGTV